MGAANESPHLRDADVVRIYRAMTMLRAVDRRADELALNGHIGLGLGAAGDEACVVGAALALRPGDWIFPTARDAGAALVRGAPLVSWLDNLLGNARDVAQGRQLPGHLSHRASKVSSVSTLSGTHITHAVGLSWAAKLRGDAAVVLVLFEASAVDSGEFHNGMNFAGVFRTPTVLVCKSYVSASQRAGAHDGVAGRGVAYGVHAVACDGQDVFAVSRAVTAAVARAAGGDGPTLVDARIVTDNADSDPLVRVRQYLSARVGFSDEQQRELEASVATEIDKAIAAARDPARPAIETMLKDVFAEAPGHLVAQQRELAHPPHGHDPRPASAEATCQK